VKHGNPCPKCQAANILRVPGHVGGYGSGNNIQTGFWVTSAVLVSRYICLNCGFVEEWIDNPNDLGVLYRKYANVTGSDQSRC
jgi:hypothetical protein